ncbi:MAG: hypothetical protein ABJZ62_00345, partial [Hyphomicrobiales bacterium]
MEFKSHRKECPKLLSFRNRAIRSTGSMMVALATVLIGFSSTPSHAQSNSSASSSSCAGKLGVHRTIKVSNKNTTLVG